MIYCYIPARGGSKGIKNKNLIDLNGKPLIQYTIEFASLLKNDGLVDEIFVSSNSTKILRFAEKFDDIKLVKRSNELSNSKSRTVEGIIDFIDRNKSIKNNDGILTMQPTSPFRSLKEFRMAISLFNDKKFDSIISVMHDKTLSTGILYKDEGTNSCKPIDSKHKMGIRRQDHGGLFVRNGSLYITRVGLILKNKSLISDNPGYVSMNKINSTNIDTYEDLDFARNIIK